MRQMKDSGIEWIGEIPESWKVLFAFQCFSQVKNKNEGLSETNLLSLSYGKLKRKSMDTTEGLLPESFESYNIIEAGDIVLRLTDLQNDHTSLRVGLSKERGIITSAYVTLRNYSKNVPKYLYYYLHSYDIAKGFYGMGAGVRQGLNWEGLKHLKVLAPMPQEQHLISAYLDRQCALIDSVIEKTKASIEEYKKLRQAVITQAVTKGVRGDRAMKDSGIEWIGEIPEGWNIIRLKSLFDFRKGLPITKENLTEKGVSVISYGQIHAKFNTGVCLDERLFRFVSESYLETNSSSLASVGDILVADTPEDLDGCGNAVYVDKEMPLFAGYHTILLQSKQSNTKYIAYQMLTDNWRSQLRSKASGVKLFSISKKMLSEATFIVPSILEQQEIAAYLDQKCAEIDSLITKKEQFLTELDSYKKSLIYEYVTGKKEVPQV